MKQREIHIKMFGLFQLNPLSNSFLIAGILIGVIGIFANGIIRINLPNFILQLFRYGRANLSIRKSKILNLFEVPKSWFSHFYLYSTILQFNIFIILIRLYIFSNGKSQDPKDQWILQRYLSNLLDKLVGVNPSQHINSTTSLIVSGLFLIQLFRRLLETVFLSVFSNTKMNVVHYFAGFLHYSGSILSLLAYSPSLNTTLSSFHNVSTSNYIFSINSITPVQIVGILIFFYGSIEQHLAHSTFAKLRKKGNKIVTKEHKIPFGHLFDLISCPNYFAEIIIYLSIGIIFSFNNPCWNAVLFWVISNQVTAGLMNHIWYIEKFPEYPKARKAIIPYIL